MKGNILIVEDEVLIANVLKMYVEQANYSCAGIAIDYDEALELLATNDINLALLDVNISGTKKGTDLAYFINKTYNIPVIFLTAYSDTKTIEEIKATLPFGYLKKPINKDNLLVSIEIALNNFNQKQLKKVDLKIGKESYSFNANDLVYAESEHVYVTLYFNTGEKHLVRSSLTNLLQSLPNNLLKQVNRSQAVNPLHIKKICGDKLCAEDIVLKISASFKHNF